MVDENWGSAGSFEFSDVVIIRLCDPVAGLYLDHEVHVTDGANVRAVIWDFEKALRDIGGAMAIAAAATGIDAAGAAGVLTLAHERGGGLDLRRSRCGVASRSTCSGALDDELKGGQSRSDQLNRSSDRVQRG